MKVLLIDGKNVLYRYGWTFRNLTCGDGRQTGAVYGTLLLLLRLRKAFPDARIVVAWDGDESRTKSWRSRIYPQYKQNRKTTSSNEELFKQIYAQIPLVKQMLTVVGIPHMCVETVEADDLIGILAERCLKRGWEVIVYSRDQDYLQLMTKGVKIIMQKTEQDGLRFETEANVRLKFRCSVEDLLKVRAIAGDTSDNIPGVEHGVGPVRAAKKLADGYKIDQHSAAKRNYQLMCIVDTWSFDLFTETERDLVRRSVDGTLKSLSTGRGFKVHMGDLLRFFGDLDMEDAIGRRHEILTLHV